MSQHKQKEVGSLSILFYFAVAPVVFAIILRPYAPSIIPLHMDLWGNVDKWGEKELFLVPFVLLSMVSFVLIWAAVIAKYRGQEHMGYWFIVPLIIVLYFITLALLIGIVNAQPGSLNIYKGVRWDISRVFVALMALIQPLCGAFCSRHNPRIVAIRLAFLLVGGLNYLILAVPTLTHRAILGCVATGLLVVFAWYMHSRNGMVEEHKC